MRRTVELRLMVPLILFILSTSRTRYNKKNLTVKNWVKANIAATFLTDLHRSRVVEFGYGVVTYNFYTARTLQRLDLLHLLTLMKAEPGSNEATINDMRP